LSQASYIVGIDLGTTHCCLAYAPLSQPDQVSLLPLLQRGGPGQVAEKTLLPSIRYHPRKEEVVSEGQVLPWPAEQVEGDNAQAWIGEYARWLSGAQLGRSVTSAKSWLSHPKVDRTAAILPWSEHTQAQGLEQAEHDGIVKVSPIVASASYLKYLAQCWAHVFPDVPLNQQHVVVTLPASFDDMARVMTRQACRLAGLGAVHVLEEPTAACYDWYQAVQSGSKSVDEPLQRILVCDVGGGTTDFSLVQVTAMNPMLELQRVAVGDHLMLGGDNIDLALAGIVQSTLGQEAHQFTSSQLTQLVMNTRSAKELLLSDQAPDEVEVTVLGRGSGLLSKAKTVVLTKEQVHQVVLEGYFPIVDLETPLERGNSAVVAFGLPYARDPAITKHLASFLKKHFGDDRSQLPDAVMFNGGVFNSSILRQRVIDQLNQWRGEPLTVLDNPEPHFAVAKGAVAYGSALEGVASKILATLPRHYFLKTDGIEHKGICLLPRGSQTSEVHQLGQQFALRVGEPVQMHVVASTDARSFVVGEVVDLDKIQTHALPPLVTSIDGIKEVVEEIPVVLSAKATELGTLELSCRSVDDSAHCWDFQFESVAQFQLPNTQDQAKASDADFSQLHARAEEAKAVIDVVFGKADAKAAKANPPGQLRNRIEKILGSKDQWDVSTSRFIVDQLLSHSKRRRRTAQHERVWCWMVGFCMRPGFGAPNDPGRVQQIWSLFKSGLQYDTEPQNQSQWWLMWRRVCGGLGISEQHELHDAVQGLLQRLNSSKKKKLNARAAALMKAQQAGQMDAVRLLGLCERVDLEQRQSIGQLLLTMLQKDLNNESLWWSLGRLGARVPVYEDNRHCVLPVKVVEQWLETVFQLLSSGRQFPLETVAFAVTQMSLKVSEDQYNLSVQWLDRIVQWLEEQKMPDRWIDSIRNIQNQNEEDQSRRLGEQLPYGLRLLQA